MPAQNIVVKALALPAIGPLAFALATVAALVAQRSSLLVIPRGEELERTN
jgi:hypothetical protein